MANFSFTLPLMEITTAVAALKILVLALSLKGGEEAGKLTDSADGLDMGLMLNYSIVEAIAMTLFTLQRK